MSALFARLKHPRNPGAPALAPALAAALLAAASASSQAESLFTDVTGQSGLEAFTPTVNRDASPAVFPAFFKAIGEFLNQQGVPVGSEFCGTGEAEPTCEFGQSAYIGGVVIADFNNDGRNDIFATNADGGPNALFLNQGNAGGVPQFTEVAASMNAAFPEDQASAAVAGDVNNDGYVDLYISNIGFEAMFEFMRTNADFATLGNLAPDELFIAETNNAGYNRLLINRGTANGHWLGFREAGDQTVRGQRSTRSTSPAMVDFDRDGDLDIFVAAHTNVFLVPTPTNFPFGFPGPLSKRVENVSCFSPDGVDTDGNCEPSGGPLLFENRLAETGELAFEDVTDRLREAIDTATGAPNRGLDGRPFIDSFMMFDPVWFDYDDNGYPDLVTANDADIVGVYRNVDGQTFEFVSRTALIDPGKVPFVTPDGPVDVGAVGAWMAISPGDVNGDGRLDFYATNVGVGHGPEAELGPGLVGTDLEGTAFTQPLHALYINLGDGRFVDVADQVARDEGFEPPASLGRPAMDDSPGDGVDNAETAPGHFAFGGQLFDMDNDRDLDIFNIGNLFGSGVGTRNADPNGGSLSQNGTEVFRVTNRGTLFEHKGRTRQVRFDETEGTVRVPVMEHLTETAAGRAAAGLDNPFDGRGMAIGDLDNDGYPDIVVANVSGNAADNFAPTAMRIGAYNGGLRLFQNQGAGGNRAVVLRLRGVESNASGIGARVTVQGGGRPLVRELSSNTGHRGNAGLELLVGVGKARRVNVTVDWPSGIRQKLAGIRLDGTRNCFEVTESDSPSSSARLASRAGTLAPCEGGAPEARGPGRRARR